MLAQAALSSGIIAFYTDLLRISEDTNEVYVLPIPDAAEEILFHRYAAQVLDAKLDPPLIPVGIQRFVNGRHQIFCNPRSGEPGGVLQKGDRLVVLAYEPPSAETLPAP